VTHPQVRIGDLALGRLEEAGLAALRKVPVSAVFKKVLQQMAADILELTPNTQLFNQTGQPAISLPLGWSGEGLPIGVQLAAAFGREDVLVRIASQLEAAHPWASKKPPLIA
jgi:amidase